MDQDPYGTLKALREMGLNYVECSGTYGLSAEEIRKALDDLGLKCSGTHSGLDQYEGDVEAVIELNNTLGSNFSALAWVGKEIYEPGWDKFAARLETIGRDIKAAGLVFGYHNHDFEFQLQNGKPGLDILFENADPSLVSSQLDVYWVAYGGKDPAEYIKKLKGRIPQVHYKDGKLGEGKPHYLPVGQGDLDWDGIMAACNDSGVEFASIELDSSPGDPLDAVRKSVEFLRSKGIND
jgi:sugar phosphate isomerase/epimerase